MFISAQLDTWKVSDLCRVRAVAATTSGGRPSCHRLRPGSPLPSRRLRAMPGATAPGAYGPKAIKWAATRCGTGCGPTGNARSAPGPSARALARPPWPPWWPRTGCWANPRPHASTRSGWATEAVWLGRTALGRGLKVILKLIRQFIVETGVTTLVAVGDVVGHF